MPTTSKRVVIAGGSGFLGQGLIAALTADVADVVVLTRGPTKSVGRVRYVTWDAKTVGPWAAELDGADAVVNVVGRTVDCRKTAFNKKVILESRVDSVRAIAAAFKTCRRPPPVWVQSATAHIFGDTADEVLDDDSPTGVGFAPDVGRAWEATFYEADVGDCRQVALRISFVIGRGGGALPVLARLARLGLGGTVGSGKQWMSWLHQDDLNAMILRAIGDVTMRGTYVATSPEPMRNREFMAELRRAVRRPWSPRAPAAVVRLGCFLMRTDPELVLLGRRCTPSRLLREGFVFGHPKLRESLAHLVSNDRRATRTV